MASGDTLFTWAPEGPTQFPASNYASYGRRNTHGSYLFDDSTDEFIHIPFVVPSIYTDATGWTVILHWSAVSATTGNVVWVLEFEKITGQDQDSDSFDTAVTAAAAACNGTNGIPTETSTAVAKADLDGLVAGNSGRMRISRDANHASDTMAGDAELTRVEVKET